MEIDAREPRVNGQSNRAKSRSVKRAMQRFRETPGERSVQPWTGGHTASRVAAAVALGLAVAIHGGSARGQSPDTPDEVNAAGQSVASTSTAAADGVAEREAGPGEAPGEMSGARLSRFDSGAAVSAASLDRALIDGWVVAELDRGQSMRLWDVGVEAVEPAVVLWGLSSEFLYAAVVSGMIRTPGGDVAEAADAVVWGHMGSSAARVQPYSTRDLRAALRDQGRDEWVQALEPAHRRQERRRFWGLVRPTALNVSVPLRPEVESVRRLYLLDPAVVGTKRASASAQELSRRVAETFLTALRDGDTARAAALLDPGPFEDPAQRGRFAETRAAYVASLAEQPWVAGIDPASLEPADEPRRFVFRSGDEDWALETVVFDTGMFVGSVRKTEAR